jgi:phosphatidylglycerophosphatase A
LGYAPLAPGTVGSAAGLALSYLLRQIGSPGLEGLTIGIGFALGVWCGTAAERHFAGTDPSHVVFDEVIGMLITVAFLPLTLLGALVGFLIFRVLDVVKPWPASRFERLPGGLGIMADDGMAGLYGHLLMRGLIALSPAGWLVS